MLKINKANAPEDYLQLEKQFSSYKEFGSDIKEVLRYHLSLEQNSYCPYCERIIHGENKESCHIEHMKPQALYPQLSKEYSNMLLSCNNPNTCGIKKDNDYGNGFLHPTEENPSSYLRYDLASGEIYAIDDNPKGNYTIQLLNLNDRKLQQMRRNNLLTLTNLSESSQLEIIDYGLQYSYGESLDFPQMYLQLREELSEGMEES